MIQDSCFMKVILTRDVASLGRVGDVREVSDGYARNFLIPKHLALPATSQLLGQIQKEEAERQVRFQRQRGEAEALKHKLEAKTFTIKAKASKTTLFSAIHEKEIAQATGLDPGQIAIKAPIKTIGLAEVEAKLAEDIKAKIKLDIQPL